jgi:hypothetical protein
MFNSKVKESTIGESNSLMVWEFECQTICILRRMVMFIFFQSAVKFLVLIKGRTLHASLVSVSDQHHDFLPCPCTGTAQNSDQ